MKISSEDVTETKEGALEIEPNYNAFPAAFSWLSDWNHSSAIYESCGGRFRKSSPQPEGKSRLKMATIQVLYFFVFISALIKIRG
jgi:hypothetical protein